ncbi:tyrosine-type recombinase/integrase [Cohnella luojiensis]|uniref:Site-specific integrase n=1 Tax=Cohnella luojiensis TaxID=652876 RepID=A0A4Y8MB14_9BACL|nr:site-specific integrase [Cohnella luojiensis]TFE30803.1 site-specific integrase [Cohnella luojiensis]
MASIEKRGVNSWRLIVEAGYDANGKRIKESRTIKIEDEALLKTTKKLRDYLNDELLGFKREVEAGEYIKPAKMTFNEFYEKEWIPKFAVRELKSTTYEAYTTHVKNHLVPVLGHLRLDEIKTMKLVNLFHALLQPGARKDGRGDKLSSRTVQYIFDVAQCVFSCAVEWSLIKVNPLDGVKRPKLDKVEKRAKEARKNYYEEDETISIIRALYTEATKWRLYFLGAMLGGFRRGELTALEIPDCDFENNRLRVDESISLTKQGIAIIDDPKNEASADFVDMPVWYMDELKEYLKEWKINKMKLMNKWLGGERQFVFHRGFGKPYYHTTPTDMWKQFCKKHGFRYVTLHGLRHTNATLLLEDGASMKAIQKRLRHSSSQTTSEIYAHVTKKHSRATAERLDRFNPKAK